MRFLRATGRLLGVLSLTAVGWLPATTARAQDAGSGQPAGTSAPAATTTVSPAAPKKGSLSASLSYGNNSSFFGRTQTTKYPYAAGELTYTSKVGVWGSVTSYNLFNTSSFVDETDASLGWDVDLSKTVDASLSYSRFFFAPNSPLVKSSVNNSLDGYVGWDWGYVYSRLNAAYLFGPGTQDGFLILDNSRYFEIDKVFTPKGYLAIEPRVSVTAGTQSFAETSQVQQQKRGNSKSPKGGTTTVTTTTTRFRVLSYELRVPVTYTLGNVSVQGAWRYAVPVNLLPDDVSRARSYLTASLSLTI